MAEKDRDLVKRILAGDRDAFGDLVERYGALVHGVVLEKIRRPDEVEDVVQEAFSRAYQDLPRLREPDRFASWLSRIAANMAVDWLRRHQARLAVETPDPFDALPRYARPPDEVFEESEVSGMIWETLDRLAPEYRHVVVLHHLEDCTQREIARFLDISLPAVKWRLRKARNILHRELEELLYRGAALRPRARRRLRDKVLAGLPLVFAFPVESRSWWLERWVRRILLGLGCAGALGLLGLVSGDIGLPWRSPEDLDEGEFGGFRVRREEVELPAVSVFWEPRRPRAGERVRIEAAGAELVEGGERAFLHFITNPDYERTDELAYMWAGFYAVQRDTANQVVMLKEVLHSFPESRYADDARRDLLGVLADTDPERAVRMADSLITVKSDGESGRPGWSGWTAVGMAYQLRFELFLREDDVDGAFALTERLIASRLNDPFSYQHIGGRLAGRAAGLAKDVPPCPRDLSLGVRVLEAGLPWVRMEYLCERLGGKVSSSLSGNVQAARQKHCWERAGAFRGRYLRCLGECYRAQGRYVKAVACLQEVADLQQGLDPRWTDDAIYVLLGEVREEAGDREGARDAYRRALASLGSQPQAEAGLRRLYEGESGWLEEFQDVLRDLCPVAPDFTLKDVQGQTVRLSAFRGQLVLLAYERFLSAPFQNEIVEPLQAWRKRFGRDLEILYVCGGRIDAGRLRDLVAEKADSLRVMLDDGSVDEQYQPTFASVVLIDPSGRMRLRRAWRGKMQAEVTRKIEAILAEGRGLPVIREAGTSLPKDMDSHIR